MKCLLLAYWDIENDKPIEIDGNLAANALAIHEYNL